MTTVETIHLLNADMDHKSFTALLDSSTPKISVGRGIIQCLSMKECIYCYTTKSTVQQGNKLTRLMLPGIISSKTLKANEQEMILGIYVICFFIREAMYLNIS